MLTKNYFNLFQLFLKCSVTGKQKKKSGKAPVFKHVLSKDYYRRTLEVAVRQVPQEDWAFCRATRYHKAPSSTLKEIVLLRQVNILMLGAVLKKLEMGKLAHYFLCLLTYNWDFQNIRYPYRNLFSDEQSCRFEVWHTAQRNIGLVTYLTLRKRSEKLVSGNWISALLTGMILFVR